MRPILYAEQEGKNNDNGTKKLLICITAGNPFPFKNENPYDFPFWMVRKGKRTNLLSSGFSVKENDGKFQHCFQDKLTLGLSFYS